MRDNYSEKSHLLKHCLLHHKEKNPDEVRFGMKLRRQYKTALERQIGEAVAILEEKEKGTLLMNSKSEFNRCQLPRKSVVMGQKNGQRENSQNGKKWAEFEDAICQLSRELGQNNRNTSELRPKNEDLNMKNWQNDGVLAWWLQMGRGVTPL